MKIWKWISTSLFLILFVLAADPLYVSASGQVKENEDAVIDYYDAENGNVTVNYTGKADKRLKVQVAAPKVTYTYDLPVGDATTFPLSEGDGDYKVTVFENVSGKKYATVLSASFQVKLSSETAPFLGSNQYVDYEDAQSTLSKAKELVKGVDDTIEKVEKVYDFVVGNLTYDTKKAANVKSGYLPVLDSVLSSKKGICFDYAALMAGMLRSQGIPCKLVVGYAGTAYHAWISVWTEEEGWIDGIIYFDGKTWKRMDPTFASASKSSDEIMEYIGDGDNYSKKYQY